MSTFAQWQKANFQTEGLTSFARTLPIRLRQGQIASRRSNQLPQNGNSFFQQVVVLPRDPGLSTITPRATAQTGGNLRTRSRQGRFSRAWEATVGIARGSHPLYRRGGPELRPTHRNRPASGPQTKALQPAQPVSTIFRLDKGHSQTRQPGSSPGTRNTPGLAPGSLRHPSRNTSWETEVLYGKLDQNLSRPMGPTNDPGLQARMVRTSYSGGSPSVKKLTRQLRSDAERVRYSAPKRSNSSTGPPKPLEGLNLSPLNRFIQTTHFKMEGIHLLRDLLQKQDWLSRIDLKDAYFTVPVHPPHQEFLHFSWEGKDFQFTCLPFGLSSAPRVFTKLLKPVIGFLRSQGVRCIIYMDDLLIMAQSQDTCLQHTQ